MRTEDALGRILEGFERLEKRLEAIEGRLSEVEEAPPPPDPAVAAAPAVPGPAVAAAPAVPGPAVA
ncbi:MAG: hypothetical protein ACYTED_07935, partial [Planctomycetota bacterium]